MYPPPEDGTTPLPFFNWLLVVGITVITICYPMYPPPEDGTTPLPFFNWLLGDD
ncbi:hypothetical protein BS78_08G144200 [Paspalum vaginatum]|nr:hypothetical protein BS78_08G144200 [Paspalum vaginatum]